MAFLFGSMKRSRFLFEKKGIFDITPRGKDGKLTESQYVLKRETERPYFYDANALRADPRGKFFRACAYPDGWKPFAILKEEFLGGKKIDLDNWKGTKIFFVFELPYYAFPFMKEWKDAIVERFPKNEIFAIELRIPKFGYGLLRLVTDQSVQEAWCSDLSSKEEKELRMSRFLTWKQTNAFQGLKMRENIHLDNKFVPYIYGVNEKGNINFRAVGKLLDGELDVLQKVI